MELSVEHGGSSSVPESRFDIAVVEPDPRLRMRLSLQLAGAQQFDAIEDVVQFLRPGRPMVAVFGPGLAGAFGFQQVHRLTTAYSELGAVFVVPELSTEMLQQALRSGARDAVQLEEHGTTLAQSVARVGETLANVSTRLPVASGGRVDPGRLVVVFSPKGGVGKSTVAINVAVCMAQHLSEPVALVDADVQFGDVAVLLGVPPQQTVVDAAAAVHFGDAEMMRTILTRHDSGLLVLPAPAEPSLAPNVAPDELVAICAALQSQCSHVVVDLPTTFDDLTFALIEAADDVLLVGSMDIPSVKNLKIGMQALDLVTVAGPKLKLVLNRANTRVKLDVREIEQVLGIRADFPIPSDIAVPLSVNAGVPVVLYEPRSAAARALDLVAVSLLGAHKAAATAGGGAGGKRRIPLLRKR
jgi:pilus assembly protein CpaE